MSYLAIFIMSTMTILLLTITYYRYVVFKQLKEDEEEKKRVVETINKTAL